MNNKTRTSHLSGSKASSPDPLLPGTENKAKMGTKDAPLTNYSSGNSKDLGSCEPGALDAENQIQRFLINLSVTQLCKSVIKGLGGKQPHISLIG